MKRTLILIKPCGIQKKIVGEIFRRIENENLKIIKLERVKPTEEQISEIYKESLKEFSPSRQKKNKDK